MEPSQHGASLTVLRMAEITLIEAVASEQVIVEVERNLSSKLPATLPAFRLLVDRGLGIVPAPTAEQLAHFQGTSDPHALPILLAAMQLNCSWLITFNVRHFRPGHPDVTVLPPGEFVQRVRYLLAGLNP